MSLRSALASSGVVDERKLNDLPDEKFLELRRSGGLGLVYLHLVSFANLRQLGDIAAHAVSVHGLCDPAHLDKLSRLSMTGGSIRNIALNAAFLAADEAQSVRMEHVLLAARTEYIKLEKPLTDAEVKGWL